MKPICTAVLSTLCCLAAALPAQGGTKKPKAGKPDAAAKDEAVHKDDAFTAKDKAIVALDKFLAKKKVDKKADDWRLRVTEPETLPFEPEHVYTWHLATTEGELALELLPAVAPKHVSSILYLTRLGFYDGLTFHRVIPGFMAQGGCPKGDGTGSPNYKMSGEFDPDVKHDAKGVLSTANEQGNPKSDGSQFFITFAPTPHLDGKHTIAGRVTSGMETLGKLEAQGSAPAGKTKQRLGIERAWITVAEKPKPEADQAGEGREGEKGSKPTGTGKDAAGR